MNGPIHDELAAAHVTALMEDASRRRLLSQSRIQPAGFRGTIGRSLVSLGEWIGGCNINAIAARPQSR